MLDDCDMKQKVVLIRWEDKKKITAAKKVVNLSVPRHH